MIDDYHPPEPTFSGSGHYVLMDPNAYAPMLHIDGFATEAEAEAWIRDESAAWFAKRVAAGM